MWSVFRIKKEERGLALGALVVFAALNALQIASHFNLYVKGGNVGFWSIFFKHFRISGYDCWSYITLSDMRIHFETARHPLYFTFLYPLYLLNHWMMAKTGVNFAVFFMAVILVLSAFYAAIFMYRVLREVIGLSRTDATLLTALLFSFAHVMVPVMCPDHFVISLMLLTMTLYIAGMAMKKGRLLRPWQSFLLLFFTTGIAVSNGVKTLLGGLFVNRQRFFRWPYLLFGVVLPLLLLWGIRQYQYHAYEIPQKALIRKYDQATHQARKNDSLFWAKNRAHQKWVDRHNGRTWGTGPITKLIDVSTPRGKTLVENFFGESIQLHRKALLLDVQQDRPVFVDYEWIGSTVIEGLMVLLLLVGIVVAIRKRLMLMVLSWFGCDLLLNMVLGFGINEVYIMTSGWAFIIPVAWAYLMQALQPKYRLPFRILIGVLTGYLWIYNGSLVVGYLLR